MKEEDKNKKTDLSDFLRYTGNKMTVRERNALERELQKDPFAEEAVEGLSAISSDEALKDIAGLKRNLKSRVSRRDWNIYYRIAASVAVLILLSSVFYFINRSKNTLETMEIALDTSTPLEITESNAISEPVKAALENNIADRYEKKHRNKADETNNETELLAGQKDAEKYIAAGKTDADEVSMVVADNIYIAEDKKIMLAPKAEIVSNKSSTRSIKGRIISSEDNQPVPAASVLVKGTNTLVLTDSDGNFNINISESKDQIFLASYIGMESKEFKAEADTELQVSLEPSLLALNEVVVVGYGASRRNNTVAAENAAFDDAGYSAPEPIGGKQEFDSYIEKNIHKPAGQAEGERVVVIINFILKSDGVIESIKAIRSPGEEYSAEAIRLIKEGPAWKPATENGERIDDEVRVRIIFR